MFYTFTRLQIVLAHAITALPLVALMALVAWVVLS